MSASRALGLVAAGHARLAEGRTLAAALIGLPPFAAPRLLALIHVDGAFAVEDADRLARATLIDMGRQQHAAAAHAFLIAGTVLVRHEGVL